ncbi:MAG: hypothetical protein ACR2MA_10800 [Egibacteraceae bacterium]
MIKHDIEVAFGIGDVVTVLADGALLATGAPDEIRSNPDVIVAYLGNPDGAA